MRCDAQEQGFDVGLDATQGRHLALRIHLLDALATRSCTFFVTSLRYVEL